MIEWVAARIPASSMEPKKDFVTEDEVASTARSTASDVAAISLGCWMKATFAVSIPALGRWLLLIAGWRHTFPPTEMKNRILKSAEKLGPHICAKGPLAR